MLFDGSFRHTELENNKKNKKQSGVLRVHVTSLFCWLLIFVLSPLSTIPYQENFWEVPYFHQRGNRNI